MVVLTENFELLAGGEAGGDVDRVHATPAVDQQVCRRDLALEDVAGQELVEVERRADDDVPILIGVGLRRRRVAWPNKTTAAPIMRDVIKRAMKRRAAPITKHRPARIMRHVGRKRSCSPAYHSMKTVSGGIVS